jgi:uncharacterized membrane protein
MPEHSRPARRNVLIVGQHLAGMDALGEHRDKTQIYLVHSLKIVHGAAATIHGVQAFWDWVAQVPPLWGVILLNFLPALELRAAIPYGLLATDLSPTVVITAAVITNWLVAPLVYLFLRYVLRFLLRWGWFAGHWQRYSERVQRKISRAVESWGAWGLALFIGIPLPGSGVYTGALGAYLLGMSFRRFMLVALAGVVIAATLVSIIVLSGSEALGWMVNESGAK